MANIVYMETRPRVTITPSDITVHPRPSLYTLEDMKDELKRDLDFTEIVNCK